MRRFLSLVFAALLFCSLIGCHYSDSGDILEPVEFYYPRNASGFAYGSADAVITAEIREASGHTQDLNYLLTMYLRGPLDSGLRSPFPAGCTLLDVSVRDDSLTVRLSSAFTALENLELTTACAALAKTCLSITDAQNISIYSSSGDKTVSVMLRADSLQFVDSSVFESLSDTE